MKKTASSLLAALLASTSFASSYSVAEKDVPVVNEKSPWLIRARALWVKPDPSSSTITTIGGTVNHISSTVVPELDFSYFFTNNIAAELILATARHHVVANGTTLGQVDLGKVNLLPPTLTVQYHFMPDNTISPYVGAGVNYTHFYKVNTGPIATSINYDNAWGGALQAGVDYKLNDTWSLNVDVKKIFLKTDVAVTALNIPMTTNVKINPWLVGVGVGYRV